MLASAAGAKPGFRKGRSTRSRVHSSSGGRSSTAAGSEDRRGETHPELMSQLGLLIETLELRWLVDCLLAQQARVAVLSMLGLEAPPAGKRLGKPGRSPLPFFFPNPEEHAFLRSSARASSHQLLRQKAKKAE